MPEGKHRDPLNRRRKPYDEPKPEVLGVDVVQKLKVENPKLYGKDRK